MKPYLLLGDYTSTQLLLTTDSLGKKRAMKKIHRQIRTLREPRLKKQPVVKVPLAKVFRFTVLPQSGTIVVRGDKEDGERGVFLYALDRGSLKEIGMVPRENICHHIFKLYCMKGITVGGQELVAAVCHGCRDVRFINPATGEVSVVFNRFKCYSLCQGQPDHIWVHTGQFLREVNCMSQAKTGRKLRCKETFRAMCFVPNQDHLAVGFNERLVLYSCDTGEELCSLHEVNGEPCRPLDLLFEPMSQCLAVCEGDKLNRLEYRMLLLDSRDLSPLQIVAFVSHLALGLALTNNQLLLLGWYSTFQRWSLTTHFKPEYLAAAFREACKNGTKASYRARINIIGHSGAGKTTLTKRLLGEPFQATGGKTMPTQGQPEEPVKDKKRFESTDGIETHRIEFFLDEMEQEWLEPEFKPENLTRSFHQEILMFSEELDDDTESEEDSAFSDTAKEDQPSEEDRTTQDQNEKARSGLDEQQKEDSQSELVTLNVKLEVLEQLSSQEEELTEPEREKGILCLWDFGGQTEFYATHHMFLDANAINIITMDISKGLKYTVRGFSKAKKKSGIPTTQEEFLCYWMTTIQSEGRKKGVQPNIALVLTHKDLIPSRDVHSFVGNFLQDVQNLLEKKLLPAFPENNIYVVDNTEGTDENFSKLRSQLFQMMKNQKVKLDQEKKQLWGLERPIRWLGLEAEMVKKSEKNTQKPVKYLKYEEVQEMSKAFGMEESELKDFLGFHHTMGDLVHYSEPILADIIIMDPQWLVDVFKVLITAEEFIKKDELEEAGDLWRHGKVSHQRLQKFWKHQIADVDFLVELMRRFDLILPLESEDPAEKKFLVPCMMPVKEVNPNTMKLFKKMKKIYQSVHCCQGFGKEFPIGFISTVMANLSNYWPITEDLHLSYRYASFDIDDNTILTLTQMQVNTIEVIVWRDPHALRRNPLRRVREVRRVISESLRDLKKCKMLCPHWKPEDKTCAMVRVQEKAAVTSQNPGPEHRDGKQEGAHAPMREMGIDMREETDETKEKTRAQSQGAQEIRIEPVHKHCQCHGKPIKHTHFAAACGTGAASGTASQLGATAAETPLNPRPLTDRDLIRVARYLCERSRIFEVGVFLGIPRHIIRGILYDHRRVNDAAQQVLFEWQQREVFQNLTEAWWKLREAMVEAELEVEALSILDRPAKGQE